MFDVVINNADRKGGHILGSGGRVFGVDHGVSFHTDHKLRTLLWGWAGLELTTRELAAVRQARDDAPDQLGELLGELEIEALVRRAELLLHRQRLPRPARGVARRSRGRRSERLLTEVRASVAAQAGTGAG